jgi:hypothetical protein
MELHACIILGDWSEEMTQLNDFRFMATYTKWGTTLKAVGRYELTYNFTFLIPPKLRYISRV